MITMNKTSPVYRYAEEDPVTCSEDECRTLPKHLSVGRLKVT